jgi:hypothetical protein
MASTVVFRNSHDGKDSFFFTARSSEPRQSHFGGLRSQDLHMEDQLTIRQTHPVERKCQNPLVSQARGNFQSDGWQVLGNATTVAGAASKTKPAAETLAEAARHVDSQGHGQWASAASFASIHL